MGHEIDAAQTSGTEDTGSAEQAYRRGGHGRGYGYGGDNLGGLDLDWHCKEIAGPDARSVLLGRTAEDWFCRVHGNTFPIDMEEACRAQYPVPGVRAEVGNYHDAYSWYCSAF